MGNPDSSLQHGYALQLFAQKVIFSLCKIVPTHYNELHSNLFHIVVFFLFTKKDGSLY